MGNFEFKEKGFSLLEVMVGLAILVVISAGLIELIRQSNVGVGVIEERLAVTDLSNTLISLTVGKNLCAKEFLSAPAKFTFPLATFSGQSFPIDSLYVNSTDITPLISKNTSLLAKTSVSVENILFENITGAAPPFLGDLVVSFSSKMGARKPIRVKFSLAGSVTGTDVTLTGCTVSTDQHNSIIDEGACLSVGGQWVDPGGGRPSFCTLPNDILEWY